MRFKIDWASLIVGSKFTVFALFYFVWGQFSKYKPPGGLYLEGRFNRGFLCYRFGGLIFGGAYIRRGLSTEGSLRFKIDWASLIVGSNLLFLL